MSSADSLEGLYAAWLGALPGFFRAVMPRGIAAPDSPDVQAAAHPAVQPVLDAVALTQQVFDQLGKGYARMLMAALAAAPAGGGQLGVGEWGAATPARELFNVLTPGFDPQAPHPLVDGLDHTFTALADAFGLAPSRSLRDAYRDLSIAEADRLAAAAGYFAFLAGTWGQVLEGVASRLGELGARGESIDSLMALARLWTGVADRTAHEAMQSEEALQLGAAYVRAATRAHRSRNRVVEIVSELYNVPTQAHVDEAYREIQQLKRRLRRLERRMDGSSRPASAPAEEREP